MTAPPPPLVPPAPPEPPTAPITTVLLAEPVDPDELLDVEPAPELALLVAVPTAIASPVSPELPESPDV